MRAPALVLAAVLLGAFVPAAATSPGVGRNRPSVNFLSTCGFSHTSPDDPIVHPGHPGASHQHLFFGSRATNAFSTARALRSSQTTCNRRADTAAYWVPALYSRGRRIQPDRAVLYYQTRSRGPIRAFPAGLRIVAGSAAATRPQPITKVFWNCSYPSGPLAPSLVPRPCRPSRGGPARRVPRGARGQLALNVVFPDCWDGRHLDSRDHQSHMAYSRDLVCPSHHPVKVPRLRLTAFFETDGTATYTLASGGVYSGHADFFNAWDQRELERLVRRCSAGVRACATPGP